MNNYITGSLIRKLREDRRMTQEQLAEKVCVTAKAISNASDPFSIVINS